MSTVPGCEMKYIFIFIIMGLILSMSLISATEDHDEEIEEELSFWEKIVKWFKGLFGSNNGSEILENFDGKAEFYKEISCSCCEVHSRYIKNKGLNPEIINMDNVSIIKKKYGVPSELYSCHTMILGDYFIEGHMPVEAIEKLITEKPDIAGITLPGMPSGSPGMPGPKTETWIIYAVNHDGSYDEFMKI